MSLVEATNLSFSFGRHQVLKNVSWRIESHQVWHLEGENGSGKTTLLQIIAGLLHPDQGGLVRKGGLSYYGPEIGLYNDLSVDQNLRLFARISPLDEVFHRRLFALFDLTSLLPQKFRQLSHGQRYRVQLCRALSVRADLYLLDEPFEGLDTKWLSKLCQALSELSAQGKSLIVTSHMRPEGFQASKRARLAEGGLVF